MRLQPRTQTLEIWRSVAEFCKGNEGWVWGGRNGRNSISDAEQILCLMHPATVVRELVLDMPEATAEDVLDALMTLGDRDEIPTLLIDVIGDYMATYTSETGTPIFAGDSYFHPIQSGTELTERQRSLDVVSSFSTSISLTLATLGFLKVFSRSVHRPELREKIATLETLTSNRLSAAMVGLLRSFCFNTLDLSDKAYRVWLQVLNQHESPDRIVLANLRRDLRPVRALLRDATIGITPTDDVVDNEDIMFECGWSWSVVQGAPTVETTEPIGPQPDGVAIVAPYLHFTVIALDSIDALFSDRTRTLGLLNSQQQRLAQALQLRWDIALAYWSRIARFGPERWPLEDVPWRTVDGEESAYFSLLVTAVVLLDLLARRATEKDLTRTIAVIEELAMRGRINRRVTRNDPAAVLHHPGQRIELIGAELFGPAMSWLADDYSALLLKHATRAAGLSRTSGDRERLLSVAEDALTHLWKRRLRTGPAAGLWDDPSGLVPNAEIDRQLPSWHLTERMLDALVTAAARASNSAPNPSALLLEVTNDLLTQAEHILSQEQLAGDSPGSGTRSSLQVIEAKLQQARRLLQASPGIAHALVVDALRECGDFALARQDAEQRF